MTPMEQLLPQLYRQTPEDTELQRVLTLMLAKAERDKDFTLAQLFPSTAGGWGLALWERAWGIPVDRTLSDEQRQRRILSKVKGVGTTTIACILALAQVYWPKISVVEIPPEYRFQVLMLDTVGNIPYLDSFVSSVNELKPAHLAWNTKFIWTMTSQVYVGAYSRSAMTAITDLTLPQQGGARAYIGTYTRAADVSITNITV